MIKISQRKESHGRTNTGLSMAHVQIKKKEAWLGDEKPVLR